MLQSLMNKISNVTERQWITEAGTIEDLSMWQILLESLKKKDWVWP